MKACGAVWTKNQKAKGEPVTITIDSYKADRQIIKNIHDNISQGVSGKKW